MLSIMIVSKSYNFKNLISLILLTIDVLFRLSYCCFLTIIYLSFPLSLSLFPPPLSLSLSFFPLRTSLTLSRHSSCLLLPVHPPHSLSLHLFSLLPSASPTPTHMHTAQLSVFDTFIAWYQLLQFCDV